MACFHPLRAFDTGLLTDNYKHKYKICGPDVERIHAPHTYVNSNGLNKDSRKVWQDRWITDWVPVPCGQCIGCRLDYSRMWADRCMLEAQEYQHNAFITLTYDPEHLPPLKECVNVETGEIFLWPSLVPDELTKFMKDLRNYYMNNLNHTGIRFYACGEYGGEGGRPHFHILAFNLLPLPDMRYWFTTDQHEKIYHSEILQNKIWKKGICSIGELTWNSCAYVARYVVKKQKGATKGLVDLSGNLVSGLEPEFTRMSRMPGIAWKYYDEHKHEFYETDEIVIAVRGKARTIKPPRYFDKMYDLENVDPFIMRDIKERRAERAKESMKEQLMHTDLNESEYLAVKERNKLAQIKALKRGLKV